MSSEMDVPKALEAGYGTDVPSSATSSRPPDTEDVSHWNAGGDLWYFQFRDRLASDIRAKRGDFRKRPVADIRADRASLSMTGLIRHAHQTYGLDNGLASEWCERFLGDLGRRT